MSVWLRWCRSCDGLVTGSGTLASLTPAAESVSVISVLLVTSQECLQSEQQTNCQPQCPPLGSIKCLELKIYIFKIVHIKLFTIIQSLFLPCFETLTSSLNFAEFGVNYTFLLLLFNVFICFYHKHSQTKKKLSAHSAM